MPLPSDSSKSVKSRNWSFIVYPESANLDWQETLKGFGLKGFISPLHDKDLQDDGTPKKPHYHVTVIYGNTTTSSNIYSSVCQPLGKGATHPVKCLSVEGSFDYTTHDGFPDKFQYSKDDIQAFGGFNIMDYRKSSKSDDANMMVSVHNYILDNDIMEYSVLLTMLIADGDNERAMFVFNHASAFNYFCRSRRFGCVVPRGTERT